MRLPQFITQWLWHRALAIADSRDPDVVIGERYMRRWHILPRNRCFNIYLHHFLGSDDSTAHHDHPWTNISFLLSGRYTEYTIAKGGTETGKAFNAGALKMRLGTYAHRIEMFPGETCWTLFITGPKYREWFFHCKKRLVHWREFTKGDDSGVRQGCGEYS
jgi:hypothetical protein